MIAPGAYGFLVIVMLAGIPFVPQPFTANTEITFPVMVPAGTLIVIVDGHTMVGTPPINIVADGVSMLHDVGTVQI